MAAQGKWRLDYQVLSQRGATVAEIAEKCNAGHDRKCLKNTTFAVYSPA